MKKKIIVALLAGAVVGAAGASALWMCAWGINPLATDKTRNVDRERNAPRPWAMPLTCEGVENLHRVSADLYRGAQPTAEGFRRLKDMGIKTVINFRHLHGDREKIGETGLAYEHLYVNTLHPEDTEIVRFLQIVTDPARQPVFVHCLHGADRTGMMCAAYRVAVDGWSTQQAIDEWTEGGFGFHEAFQNLIHHFRRLDMEDMKRRAGIPAPANDPQASTRESENP